MDTQSSETKDTVLLKNAQELLDYSKSEENHMEAVIKGIVNSGVNCVVVGGNVSDMALHFLDKYNILVVRILSKFEMRRLCKCLGATLLTRLGAPTPEEMGVSDRVLVDEIGGQKCVVFERNSQENKLSTIVIRGSSGNLLDNVEKTIGKIILMFRKWSQCFQVSLQKSKTITRCRLTRDVCFYPNQKLCQNSNRS